MKTTLILEDDFELAAHWSRLLEADGIRVIHESTAEDAIAVLRDEPVDLLITDLVIQDAEMNASLYGGLMVISYIAMNVHPAPKILAATGLDTDATFLNTYGFFDSDTALRKPISDSALVEKVQALLTEKEADDRRRVERNLLNRRMRRSLFATDRSTEAIYWVNKHGEFVYANDAASEMFELPPEGINGRFLFDVDSDVASLNWNAFWSQLSHDRLQSTELKRVNSDGQILWYSVHRHFYEFEDDQFIVSNATNITIQKQDAQRIKDNAELLREINRELARSNSELERFAYVASHDLKSPLRGIGNSILILQEDFADQINAQANKYLSNITDGVARMNRLIDDLLLYSRVFRDDSALQPINLNECIEAAKRNLMIEIVEANATITVAPLPTVVGIAPLMQQVMQNMIGNGIKYRGTDAPKITISGDEGPHGTDICIRDNGIGIEPKFHHQVFEVFKRLHRKEEYSGTGIGLAICQRVMERHKGSIQIESNEDEPGCCFILKFPSRDLAHGDDLS